MLQAVLNIKYNLSQLKSASYIIPIEPDDDLVSLKHVAWNKRIANKAIIFSE